MMKWTKWIALLVAATVALTGCEKKDQEAGETEQTEKAEQTEQTDEAKEAEEAERADASGEEEKSNADKAAAEVNPALLEPSKLDEEAPESFQATFETTEGDFVIEFNRDWAPHGVDRAYNLIKNDYYDGIPFFRVMKGFMAQFGIHTDPKVNEAWLEAFTEVDPQNDKSNTRGMVTFAQRQGGPATRTTHLFINYGNNAALDQQNFIPVGKVVEGMEVVEKLYAGYGGGPPTGPSQKLAIEQGGPYFEKNFPELDYIKDAEIAEKADKADKAE